MGFLNSFSGLILGGILGLALGVIFEDPLKEWWNRWRRLGRARRIRKEILGDGGPVSIANRQTSVYLVEGDGLALIEPQNIGVKFRRARNEPPELVRGMIDLVDTERTNSASSERGVEPWNGGSLVTLDSYTVSRTGDGHEEPVLLLETSESDYATFAATVLSLDTPVKTRSAHGDPSFTTLRATYLGDPGKIARAVAHPIPFLANGIGVTLLAFTDDSQVILVRRRAGTRARPAQRDVSVVEGLHAANDFRAGTIDITAAAVRGCREELGIEVAPTDVRILAFGVDTTYYQWSFLGLVDTRCTAAEVVSRQAAHARDRWEGKIEVVPADPRRIFAALRRDGIWDLGLVTAYLALTYKIGVKPVREATVEIFGS